MVKGNQGDLFARHDHAHLKLTRTVNPQPRRKDKSKPVSLCHPQVDAHANTLGEQATSIRMKYRARTSVLGVDPDLLLIFELNRPIDQDALAPRGLDVLEATDQHAMVAFASDSELTAFYQALERYAAGPPPHQKSAPFQKIFDAIERIRSIEPDDIIDRHLLADLSSSDPKLLLRVDVECWCPEDQADARARYDEMSGLIGRIGTVVDRSFRHYVGISIIRADVTANIVRQLADTTRVRRVSRLPRPILSRAEVLRMDMASLPPVLAPARDAPIVAVIDSGVRGEHPLLRPAVRDRLSIGSLDPDSDDVGHGTMVAGLALHGSLELPLNSGRPLRPAGRLVSIRVLAGGDRSDGATFPTDRIWQSDIIEALELAAEYGARVVNLSLGDCDHPYRPPAPIPLGAAIDELARRHNLVVVISSGNIAPYALPPVREIVHEYPRWLLGLVDLEPEAEAGLAPPAMAALALTVGAVVGAPLQGARSSRTTVDQTPIGNPGEVSPISRIGPGIEHSIKPELVAPGGSYWLDHGRNLVYAAPDSNIVGPGGTEPDQLLAHDAGTSFAAPLVTHAALQVLGHYPQLSGNAVRALLLASATESRTMLSGGSPSDLARQHRHLTGFGTVDNARAEFSSDYRAVLLADSEIEIDAVHLYSLPIPRAFFDGGTKSIRVALAHDPPVRASRAKYLSNRMYVFAYRGVAIDEVRRRYAAYEGADEQDVPEFPDRNKIVLSPSSTDRSRGANQLGVAHYRQRWTGEDLRNGEIVLAVRCTGRWPTGDTTQGYALAVVLETDGSGNTLYDELRARMPLLTEVQAEIR